MKMEMEPWQERLVADARVARLATVRADGAPHLVPVVFAQCDGRFVIAIDEKPKTTTRLARLHNIEREPRVALLVDRYAEDWNALAWVRIDGEAVVLPRGDAWPAALAALRARYPQQVAMDLEARPLIVITPDAIRGWRARPGD